MLRSVWGLILLACAAAAAEPELAIYEVPPMAIIDGVGARDANIMADDVHFETASIIREIRIPLVIAGVQTCQLWIFDGLGNPPIHTITFTNQPATQIQDFTDYVLELQVQVPRDIYIGFSAQGGGFGGNATDYWIWGTNLARGVTGTPGQYYFGPVAGGMLTEIFEPTVGNNASSSFGCLQILAEPVQIEEMTVVTGHVQLAIISLPIHATNAVESSSAAAGTNWLEQAILPLGVSSHVWSATNPAASSLFYRVKSR